jgi:hypothetical protein
MGDIVRPDRAISHPILKEIVLVVDKDWEGQPGWRTNSDMH